MPGTSAQTLDDAIDAAGEFDPVSRPGDSSTSCPLARHSDIPKACQFILPGGRDSIVPKDGSFDKNRTPHLSSKPIDETYTFRGDTKPRPATTQLVTVRGRTIAVTRPADGSMGNQVVPSNDQIANSLAALDDRQLDSIDTVAVGPNRSPDDAYWAQQKDRPNFRSQASAGPRTIDWYPMPSDQQPQPFTQAQVDRVIQHEAGHEYANSFSQSEMDRWRDAIHADTDSVSAYGDTSEDEDVAEFSELYAMVRNTPCESSLQKLYPNRYQVMKQVMTRPLTKPKPPPPPAAKMKLKPGVDPRQVNPFEDLEPDDGKIGPGELIDPFAEEKKPKRGTDELMNPNED